MAPVSPTDRLRCFVALLASVCLLTSAATPIPAASLSVTAVRFWSLNDVTRVAIEVSGEFHYSSDRIPNPDRMFFDIRQSRSKLRDRGEHVIPVGDPFLKKVRVAQTQQDVTRVVLDLEPGVEVVSSQLANPDRLMLELRRKGAAVPTSTLTAPLNRATTTLTRMEPVAPRKIFELPEPAAPRAPILIVSEPPRLVSSASIRDLITPDVLRAKRLVAPPPATSKPVVNKIAAESKPVEIKKTDVSGGTAATAAKSDSTGGRSMTRVLGLKIGRVVIDPGHGGHDTGTIGPGGLYEKNLVLDVAKRLGAMIEERMGSEVIYTRSDDTYVGLEARTTIANQHRADLFISIHANSSSLRTISGVETYYLNFSSVKADLEVASRENASSQKTVYELKDMLQKIASSDKIEESREFAHRVQASMFARVLRDNPSLRNRGVKKAPFVVLIGAEMPSILTEIGFISNPKEEALMTKADQRQKVAESIYKGLSQYALTLSHFQVAQRGVTAK